MKIHIAFILLIGTSLSNLYSQSPKIIPAKRNTKEVKIDGKIDGQEWSDATLLNQFTQLRPIPNKAEDRETRTEAYIMYSDDGIYFGGTCFESNKDSISKELRGRDGFGNNDFVGIILDTYKDNLNAFEYMLTPLNEQWDARISPSDNNDEDFSWNAVWESATTIHDNGWSFEIFIPFASIRFSKKDIQDWGLNIVRRKQKTGEQLFWNTIDPNVNGFLTQEGYWTGLKDIKPPLRLQLSPYISYYSNHFPINQKDVNNFSHQVNGGMDLKWGINQAFTLDATLIPDFGQVQSDPRVLNLTPFEVQFNEFRPFFTEGTDLFNKGGLFYSRRIGGTPFHFYSVGDQLAEGEMLVKNPSETRLINASKISGRTQNGLGIGVLNAISNASYATIENPETNTKRDVQTSPVTNYSVFVLNKSLKNNSSYSFVNTNVLRFGNDYDANVSAFLLDLNNKSNTYNIGGQFNGSQILSNTDKPNDYGYSHNIYAGKTSGEFRFRLWQELADAKYTSNDLGYFTNNNYMNQGFWIGIRKNNPTSWYNNLGLNINTTYSTLYNNIGENNPNFQFARINFNSNMQTKKLHYFGMFADIRTHSNDFYEPRVAGKYLRLGSSVLGGLWFESNQAKTISFNTEVAFRNYLDFYGNKALDIYFSPKWRVNDKLSFAFNIGWLPRFNNVGFTSFHQGEPIFAKRNISTFENTIRAKYNFTNRMGINLVARHYSRSIDNQEIFNLQDDGRLLSNTLNPTNYNRTANFFNVDMVYTWQIAQGSFVNVVWKNSISKFDSSFEPAYFFHLRETLQSDQNNNLSVKVIYFLDYNTIFKSRKV